MNRYDPALNVGRSLWRDIRGRYHRGRDLLSDWQRSKKRSGYLFIAINGAGLGHLTRCLAVARRLRDRAPKEKIIFVTTSIAVPLVHQAGFVCHHIPPFASIGSDVSNRQWNDLFYKNLITILRLHSPSTIIFDGSIPYSGLLRAMRDFRGMHRVWIKRGLYKSSVNSDRLLMQTKEFDLTISPGELDNSAGENAGQSMIPVDPILLLDEGEMLNRATARELLRLEEGTPAVFVQLGAGNINQTLDLQHKVVQALKSAGMQVVLAQSPIALRRNSHSFADSTLVDFPSSRYYEAFDFAVLAGGYNSVNEAVLLGMPAIFIPNMETAADDQWRRCSSAKAYGEYEVLEGFDEEKLLRAACRLVDRGRRLASIRPDFKNGARQAAELIIGLDRSKRGSGSSK